MGATTLRRAALGILTFLLAAPAAAQVHAVADRDDRTLTVGAVGRVERAPDQATLLLAVESLAPTARAAAAENAEKMDALLAALRELGIEPARIQTVEYGLHPEYDHRPEREQPRITGYRAMNMVRVTILDLERVGAVIDAALAAGANRVAGLSFGLQDSEAARLEALRAAIAKARTEARVVADALGEPLGPVLRVSTGGAAVPLGRPEMLARGGDMAVMAAPTPVEPGQLQVTAAVTIVYRLGGS